MQLDRDASIKNLESARLLYERLKIFNSKEDFEPKLPSFKEFMGELDTIFEEKKNQWIERLTNKYWEHACDKQDSEELKSIAMSLATWISSRRRSRDEH
ncbi:hypothetical protein ECTOBSL9_2806 [Ectothiorhodospira sp. BSL-9]|nr:hypothetical protein ECTOBSL9_2806 [Ectothiorhodospira sp. BSL-9]